MFMKQVTMKHCHTLKVQLNWRFNFQMPQFLI